MNKYGITFKAGRPVLGTSVNHRRHQIVSNYKKEMGRGGKWDNRAQPKVEVAILH